MDLSNSWGRWGEADQAGALNTLTPEVVLRALASARDGRILSLSLPIRGSTSSRAPLTVPHLRGRPLPQHFMSVDGGDYAAGMKQFAAGAMADDALVISAHGTSTHMDALSHAWSEGALYNGHPATSVRSYGATRCGIENVTGVVTRGVFLDVAGHLGVEHLEAGFPIDGSLLDEVAAAGDVDVGAGDAVLVRTGWPLVFADDPEGYQGAQPGLSYDGGRWLVERDVCMVASDNSSISTMNEAGGTSEPPEEDLHLLFRWRHGIYLAEMLWFEELASTARVDFAFVAAPLQVEGGTGSAINPLAIL